MGVRPYLLVAAIALATVGMRQAVPPETLAVVTPLVERAVVAAGATARLALEVTLPAGLHVQSDRPRDPSLIPTTLSIDAPPGVSGIRVVYPPSSNFRLQGLDEPLAVFESTFFIGVEVDLIDGFPEGALAIPLRLRYQACNEIACFPPKTVSARWDLAVGPREDRSPPRHADVFERIDFSRAEAFAMAADPPASVSAATSPAGPLSPTDQVALFEEFTLLGTGGYMGATDFVRFIEDAEAGVSRRGWFEGRGPIAILAIVFLGGLALNLTPCVLPMIPINLAIIGAGAQSGRRARGFLLGAVYGGAMALVYGLLGLVVILTAGTFGAVNASPWFNAAIAALFVVLGLAMFDVIPLDFSRLSSRIRFRAESRGTFLLAFGMGAVAALLAGACVAPVVIQVIVFASDLYAGGLVLALALPFLLGLGMALPWPLAGAGLAALPKPGAWMVRVKQAMGVFILATAAYYGYVAYGIFDSRRVDPASVQASVAEKLDAGWYASLGDGLLAARRENTLVLVDFWATWCKNCLVMDRTTLVDPEVTRALAGYTLIKFQAEDPEASPAKELLRRVGAVGLPAYAILRPPR